MNTKKENILIEETIDIKQGNVEIKETIKEEITITTSSDEVIENAIETIVPEKHHKKIDPSQQTPDKWNPFAAKVGKFSFKKDDGFETRLLEVKRVIKVTKGGRRFKFSALVVVGDKNGRVGFASAKDIEIPNAISKAERLAKKNLHKVKIIGKNKTVAHDFIGRHGTARVLLKPAVEGKGIIASNNIRAVVELAGFKNIYSKNLGTSNPKNVVYATIAALTSMRTKQEIYSLRGKEVK